MGNGLLLKLSKVILASIAILALAAAIASAAQLAPRSAGKVARNAVLASDSYQSIKSNFPLKSRGCTIDQDTSVATCTLYRSAATPCDLDGGPQAGQTCAQIVAYRLWTVTIDGSKVDVADGKVVGQFAPRKALTARKR